MPGTGDPTIVRQEISEHDKLQIRAAFSEIIAPKLRSLGARTGTLNCEFAGPRFKNWTIHFQSNREDFVITEFEYDGTSDHLDLEL